MHDSTCLIAFLKRINKVEEYCFITPQSGEITLEILCWYPHIIVYENAINTCNVLILAERENFPRQAAFVYQIKSIFIYITSVTINHVNININHINILSPASTPLSTLLHLQLNGMKQKHFQNLHLLQTNLTL